MTIPPREPLDLVFVWWHENDYGVILTREYHTFVERFHLSRQTAMTWGEFITGLGDDAGYLDDFMQFDGTEPRDGDRLEDLCGQVWVLDDVEFPLTQCAQETFEWYGRYLPQCDDVLAITTEYGMPLLLYQRSSYLGLKSFLTAGGHHMTEEMATFPMTVFSYQASRDVTPGRASASKMDLDSRIMEEMEQLKKQDAALRLSLQQARNAALEEAAALCDRAPVSPDPACTECAAVIRSMKDGTAAVTGPVGLNDELRLVMDELERATRKFPTWPDDPLHAVAILGEEFGELTKAVLQTIYEPHRMQDGELRTEAVQTAAMALRFLLSLERYGFVPSAQHRQSSGNGTPAIHTGDSS
jgi:hypothetical protein